MSLTSILNYNNKKHAEFRAVLSKLFPLPKQKSNELIKAAPLTKNYALVGTAFDYLLRFTIEKYHTKSKSTDWIAEKIVNLLQGNLRIDNPYPDDIDELELAIEETRKFNEQIRNRFNEFKKIYSKYVDSTYSLDDELLKGCLFLGNLDFVYRRGIFTLNDYDFENEDKKDIQDLNALISACNIDLFKPKTKIMLNPNFGEGSILIKGADADLIIDDILIDIKVTEEMKVTRQYYNQIICYYLLSLIGGVNDYRNYEINRLGIYFARFGYLWTINIKEIGSFDSFNEAIESLKTTANN